MVAAVDQLRAASGEFIPESGGGAESCWARKNHVMAINPGCLFVLTPVL
jgi:hypothetical protein